MENGTHVSFCVGLRKVDGHDYRKLAGRLLEFEKPLSSPATSIRLFSFNRCPGEFAALHIVTSLSPHDFTPLAIQRRQ